uniref:Uncharacterized protein n=1 Tax=Mesocestoides corti TaxID=53468 RepID=A0A5K3FTE7_MESCO
MRGNNCPITHVWQMLPQDQHSPRALPMFLSVSTGNDSQISTRVLNVQLIMAFPA